MEELVIVINQLIDELDKMSYGEFLDYEHEIKTIKSLDDRERTYILLFLNVYMERKVRPCI